MLNTRSLRFRLAVWYFSTVSAICLFAAGAYWLSIRTSLNNALDEGLRYRLIGLRHFLDANAAGGTQAVPAKLNAISQIGELFQVFDDRGALLAQSFGLERHRVRVQPPRDLGFEIRYETSGSEDFKLRLAWQKVTLNRQIVILCVADPQRKYQGVLTTFTSVMLFSILATLATATVCGLWLGRRALTPVARITEGARAISEHNLSARLAVPNSQDELQQLSETLNQMLDRIEGSFTRMKQFTADASHELRAPMTLIYTAAQFSLRRERSREELLESMRKIMRESQRTAALIDDLLLLARGDADQETVELESMDAAPLVRDLADQAAAMAAAKNIKVSLRLDTRQLPVKANDAKLRRLLLILVDNAIKYTPPDGSVTVEGMSDSTQISICVRDTGFGISSADLPHVFERFWRADKVRSRQAGGSGLGLAIAKQIADLHGAALTVQSEFGKGSVFTINLAKTAGQADV